MEINSINHNYKIILLGESNVGKSSFMLRFIKNKFDPDITSTIGIDYLSKSINYKGHKFKINIWDTAGQEKYNSIINNYYKNVDAGIIFFDLSDINSFNKIYEKWIKLFKLNCGDKPFIVIGNKKDIKDNFFENNTAIADNDSYIYPYYQISTKNQDSLNLINEIFESLVDKIYFSKNNKILEKSIDSDLLEYNINELVEDIVIDLHHNQEENEYFNKFFKKCDC